MAQVRTRKRGKTWSFIFEAGIINGKRKVVEKGGYPTKDAAYKAGIEKYTDFIHGNVGITSEAITLKDFMTNWLENVVASNVKLTPLQAYPCLFKYKIALLIGGIKIQDVTPVILDKWIRDLQKTGLSFNTLSRANALVHQALNYAVHPSQLISSNPAIYVKVPKNAPKKLVKRTIITLKQFESLLEKYPFGTPLYIPLLLLYHTGMRIGEVFGLSWADVDFANRRIDLRRQLVYIKEKGYFLAPLKTESSKRHIIVDDYLLDELKRWQIKISENEEKLGGAYIYTYAREDGFLIRQSKALLPPIAEKVSLVCVRDSGKFVIKTIYKVSLQRKGINTHSFRHTHATQLIETGAQPKGVAGRLGHASTLITQNLYTHNTRRLQEETAAVFTKVLQTNRRHYSS